MTDRVKYPHTYHLPWSPGADKDEGRVLLSTDPWIGRQVVITEKMDGENTTFYRDGMHARSLDYSPHPSRTYIRALWGEVAHEIPEGWRICGENVTAVHSIRYTDLPSRFLVFSIWDKLMCLSWEETLEWCAMLGLVAVETIYWGDYTPEICQACCKDLDLEKQEGLVVRPSDRFHFSRFSEVVGKYVRKDHVQTDEHWMDKPVEYNSVIGDK